jgi:hypothetical protein
MSPGTKDARVEAPESIRSPISTVSSVGARSNGTPQAQTVTDLGRIGSGDG